MLVGLPLSISILSSLVLASPSARQVQEQSVDILIIGGGNAGLTVASRLSENSSLVVGVLEAGGSALGDPLVDIPGYFGKDIGTKYDWNITSKGHGNIPDVYWPRGRGLGGSTLLNFEVMDRASKAEYNAWEELGSKGWNWKNLYKYMKRSEDFSAPTAEYQKATGIDVDASDYGSTPTPSVKVSFPRYVSKQVSGWLSAFESLGIKSNDSPLAGDNLGASIQPSNINPYNSTRSHSAAAYYHPFSYRENLRVITGAQAQKINFYKKKSSCGKIKAKSVTYIKDGQLFNITVNQEVIVSAGIQSSAILELSGIGDPDILGQANITALVKNANVGSNHQDHTYSAAAFELAEGTVTLDTLNNNATFAAEQAALYESNQTSILQQTVPSIAYLTLEQLVGAKREAELVAEAISYVASLGHLPYATTLRKQLEFLTTHKKTCPQVEMIGIDGFFATTGAPEAGKSYLTLLAAQQHSLSRGSIHINVSDPTGLPIFSHGYYTAPFDVAVATEGTKYLRKIAGTPEYSSYIVNETLPGAGTDIKNYTTTVGFTTEYHNIGTTSMLPRNKGGVVDNHLKVYGTSNVRVCDASIIPLHISAHIQATVYGIAEALVDIMNGKFDFDP